MLLAVRYAEEALEYAWAAAKELPFRKPFLRLASCGPRFTTPPLNKDYSAQISEVRVTHPYIVFFFCCPPPSERHNLGSDPPGKGCLQKRRNVWVLRASPRQN